MSGDDPACNQYLHSLLMHFLELLQGSFVPHLQAPAVQRSTLSPAQAGLVPHMQTPPTQLSEFAELHGPPREPHTHLEPSHLSTKGPEHMGPEPHRHEVPLQEVAMPATQTVPLHEHFDAMQDGLREPSTHAWLEPQLQPVPEHMSAVAALQTVPLQEQTPAAEQVGLITVEQAEDVPHLHVLFSHLLAVTALHFVVVPQRQSLPMHFGLMPAELHAGEIPHMHVSSTH